MSVYSNATNELNQALNSIIGAGTNQKNAKYISLHTASPGTTGANELSGGSYVRVATTWGSPSGGSVLGSQVTINVPSGNTIAYWGLWDASSSGNYYDGGALPSQVTYSANGTYLITVTLTAS